METRDSDEIQIGKITASFFGIFNNKDGKAPDWNLIHDLCIPETIIIKKAGEVQEVYNLTSFIEPRKAILSNGTLLDFEEYETEHNTRIVGNIAQRASVYRKTGIADSVSFDQKGNKLFQFVKINDMWKICAVIWEDF